VAVALAFWPFWTGHALFNAASDMNRVYPFRLVAAEFFKQFHAVPQWTPYLFGGMPYAANPTFGDTFYPGFLLRLILPVDLGMTLGMMLHITLAGTFTYLFLRELKLDWGAAFVGGAAYLFTGMVVSLVYAGHDGKIIVSALLPLALLFLSRGVTRGDWRPYLGFGVVVGLSLLSPHVQLTYYELMAAGFFWLFLVVWSGQRPARHVWWHSMLLFGVGLAVGFALDAIQLIPFAQYIHYSPRGAAGSSSTGWEYATSWAMPPEEVLNVLWPSFSGMLDNYFGRNGIKLHSEYLGVVPLMLATFAFRLKDKRRLGWFFAFLAAYGVLFAWGGHTPFYWLPYTFLPGIKLTRGAGMIFFLVSFSTAALAAFGMQAILRKEEPVRIGRLVGWVTVLAAAALLAAARGWRSLMLSFALPQLANQVDANYGVFTLDAFRALAVGALVLGLVWARRAGRWTGSSWALALGVLTLLDLWSVERRQIRFSPPASVQFAPDGVIKTLAGEKDLCRVLPVGAYTQDNYLMVHHIRSALGYQGTEIHRYDELFGGKNTWLSGQGNVGAVNLWRLLAVKYLVTGSPVQFAQLTPLGGGPLTTYDGQQVYLYRFEGHQPYAWLVAQAFKASDEQVVPTLLNARFDPRRILLVPPDAPVGVTSLPTLPETVANAVQTTEIRAGAYRFDIAKPVDQPAYLFISENWYPAWKAAVDGKPAPVVRAQMSLMAVPVPAGARVVELTYQSGRYTLGRAITVATLLLLGGLFAYGRFGAWRGEAGDG
jgi:hypothetical protein